MLCGFSDKGAQDPSSVICQAARKYRRRQQQIKHDEQLAYECALWENQVGTAQALYWGSAAGVQLVPL